MTALHSPSLSVNTHLSNTHKPTDNRLTTPIKQQALARSQRQPSNPPPAGTPSNPALDGSKKSASKVSHVICKFFKAGNCSAGTGCQFSHTLPELGQGKPVCQWFVKGNCRFAHKCALAHILPGQPMSMDRKNKRAAQAAAREAAATSANQPSDAPFLASPPPELTLELVDDDNHHSSSNHLIAPEPIDSLSSPDVIHRSRQQLLRSPRALLNDLDHENSIQNDDLQFGLPDDFVTAETSPPNGFSSERHHPPSSVERARAWPREQSPSPFGAGSPFSAPGSRSVFLPRIGSFGSEDGYPRSAPSVATSPNHLAHLASMSHHANDEDMWDEVEVDGDEDVTELLPSSLHSLLTPAERHRQHIRKHAPHTLYSRSVPVEDIIGAKLNKQSEPSALRNGMAIANPLSVSPAPGFCHAPSNETIHAAHHHLSPHREAHSLRPQLPTYLSSSYIPPSTPFGTWDHSSSSGSSHQAPHAHAAPQASQLSPPIALSSHKALERAALFGHAPGSSLPQGLAAGLSRLHFQPPLPTGLTPCGSPSANPRDHPLSPPRSPPSINNKFHAPPPSFPLSQRMAGLNFGSTTVAHLSPLSRNVSCSPGPLASLQALDDDDAPFRLEM
ncbi:hypothetical protein PtB15_2B132 [Puccinia triticina]|nr:hypothetical protein PtB15_2B132 [Puccinia triticina]